MSKKFSRTDSLRVFIGAVVETFLSIHDVKRRQMRLLRSERLRPRIVLTLNHQTEGLIKECSHYSWDEIYEARRSGAPLSRLRVALRVLQIAPKWTKFSYERESFTKDVLAVMFKTTGGCL